MRNKSYYGALVSLPGQKKTQEQRKTRKTSYDILWPVLWLDDVIQYESVWTYLKTQLILMLNLCWPLHSLGVLEYSVSFPLECHHVTCFAVLWNENNMEFVWPRQFARLINLDSLPQRCLRLILSERLSREALSRRKINFSPGEYALIGHNSINLQDFIRLIGIYHSWYYCCWCWCCCWIYHPIFQGAWSNGTCFFRGVMSGFHDMHVRARTVAKQKTSKSSPI